MALQENNEAKRLGKSGANMTYCWIRDIKEARNQIN